MQLLPGSEAARSWQDYTDQLPYQYAVNATQCRFQDLSALRNAMINCFYLRKNLCFRAEISAYVNTLQINHRDPSAPKSGLDIINRACSVFSLLPAPDNFDVHTQIGHILQRLPVTQKDRITTDAILRPELLRDMSTFRTYVEAMDTSFKHEQARKKNQQPRPSRDNNSNDQRRPYRNYTTRNDNRQQPQNGQSSQGANNNNKHHDNSNRSQVPKTPFSGKCDHCGKPGHKIRDCFHAPQAVKDEWHRKFKENRLKRRNTDNNADNGKKARLDNNNKH